jgi:hypothetical protein
MVGMELRGGRRSRWFATACWRDGGLWLPGQPTRDTADLSLRPDGIELRRDDAACRLSWEGHRRGAWAITHHVPQRYGLLGTAVAPPKPLDGDAAAVWTVTRTVRNRWRSINDQFIGEPGRRVVPLRAFSWVNGADAAERGTLAALCTLLATDEAARWRLGDPQLVARLVAELSTGALPAQLARGSLRRTTFEILGTLARLGYRHRNGGRPLPGWKADVDTVVEDVRRSLATSPYVRGLRFPEERIRNLVQREYIDVEPWPFAALTTPAAAQPLKPVEEVADGHGTLGPP